MTARVAILALLLFVAGTVSWTTLSDARIDGPGMPDTDWIRARNADHGDRALSVLYVGNSHTYINDVPGAVRRNLESRPEIDRAIVHGVLAYGGAALGDYVGRPDVQNVLNAVPWDVIVLQDRTVMPLDEDLRRSFHRAVDWFAKHARSSGSTVVLYETWPYAPGHENYRLPGVRNAGLTTPETMGRSIKREFRKAARRTGATVAPVGSCWQSATDWLDLYSEDGNHASQSGSALAAEVISGTIALLPTVRTERHSAAEPTCF